MNSPVKTIMKRLSPLVIAGALSISSYGNAFASNVEGEVASLPDTIPLTLEERINPSVQSQSNVQVVKPQFDIVNVQIESGDTVSQMIKNVCGVYNQDLQDKTKDINSLTDIHSIRQGNVLKIPCPVKTVITEKSEEDNKEKESFIVGRLPESVHYGPGGLGVIPVEIEELPPIIVDKTETGIYSELVAEKEKLKKLAQAPPRKPASPSINAPSFPIPNPSPTIPKPEKPVRTMVAENLETRITGEKTHIVESGETLMGIANKYGLQGEQRERFMAQVSNPKGLKVGRVLELGEVSDDAIRKANYGFLPNDPQGNWVIALNMNPEQVKEIRFGLGMKGLARMLGFNLGDIAIGQRSIDSLLLHYDIAREAVLDTKLQTNFNNDFEDALYTVLAVEKQETGGECRTGSTKGALGCAQKLADTAIKFGVNPFRSESIGGIANYLKETIAKYGVKLGITAYNAGEGNVQKAIDEAKRQGLSLADKDNIIYVKYAQGTLDGDGNDISNHYVLSDEQRGYYRKVLAQKKELIENDIFKFENWKEREIRIAVIDRLGYLDKFVLNDGKTEKYISKEYDAEKIKIAYLQKLKSSTMLAGLPPY